MRSEAHQKVTAQHLKRDAYLYVRQSTVRQVFENTESTKRQYALRERAVALGWPLEQVTVIDSDQGQSGAHAGDREGFQRLVAEVGMGRAGIVLGLEVSRLARNSADWHRLLEICALSDTLILDEDGLYNPCDFNDRLLLGLKGTMSEAELHVLRARLRGGILNKARRGALKLPLPVGLLYGSEDRVVLDPDKQVQQSIRHLFETFRRTGSARASLKTFTQHNLSFPRRLHRGVHKGELVWGALTHWRVLQVLHNPRYAGAFVFGRHRTHRRIDGSTTVVGVPRDQWQVLLPEAHPGYISWEHYEENQRRLRQCAQAHGSDRRKSPPREGPALLQGLVMCGVCGMRMTVRYHTRHGKQLPDYVCQQVHVQRAGPTCQHIPGAGIDEAVGKLLVEMVTPTVLEVALRVEQELELRREEADGLRHQRVERARYEADMARRRYMQVDPDNRLVADQLEAEWNEKLRTLDEVQQEYEKLCATDRNDLDDEQRRQIMALATDFPKLWHDSRTPDRERKRMVRLLIEDVTLIKGGEVTAHVRFKGGATETLSLPLLPPAWKLRQTSPAVVAEIDKMLDLHNEDEIAALLNQRGFVSGTGEAFHCSMVRRIRSSYKLTTRYERLRLTGMLTLEEIANLLNVTPGTIKQWRHHGLLLAHRYNHKGQCLYEPPDEDSPIKMQGTKLCERRRFPEVPSDRTTEVQCEA